MRLENVKPLRHLHWLHSPTVPYDFWEQAGALGNTIRHYADEFLTKTCPSDGFCTQRLHQLKFNMAHLVTSASELRSELQDTIKHTNVSIDGISKTLTAELDIVLEALKVEFPPPSNATHHEARFQKISLMLSKAEDATLRILVSHGITEEAARPQLDKVKGATEATLVVLGTLTDFTTHLASHALCSCRRSGRTASSAPRGSIVLLFYYAHSRGMDFEAPPWTDRIWSNGPRKR